eukprot:5300709-Pleurochrysis_carterae.AAC.4
MALLFGNTSACAGALAIICGWDVCTGARVIIYGQCSLETAMGRITADPKSHQESCAGTNSGHVKIAWPILRAITGASALL